MTIQERIYKELVRYLVQKAIFCPISGEVLDMDKCVVILDSDGDPRMVFSQNGWRKVLEIAGDKSPLSAGLTVDETTVK